MSFSDSDIKKLWGLAAGLCSHPECDLDCIEFINSNDPTILGEMAHIIAQSPKGPRGGVTAGDDTYENAILLCPYHHRLVDKAPKGAFPTEMLHDWKSRHELTVRTSIQAVPFNTRESLYSYIERMLIENYQIWKTFGPESEVAVVNPVSNSATLWELRKLARLIPNNSKIAKAIIANKELIEIDDYKICVKFIEHATAFERSAYERLDFAPRFPIEFEQMIKGDN